MLPEPGISLIVKNKPAANSSDLLIYISGFVQIFLREIQNINCPTIGIAICAILPYIGVLHPNKFRVGQFIKHAVPNEDIDEVSE